MVLPGPESLPPTRGRYSHPSCCRLPPLCLFDPPIFCLWWALPQGCQGPVVEPSSHRGWMVLVGDFAFQGVARSQHHLPAPNRMTGQNVDS